MPDTPPRHDHAEHHPPDHDQVLPGHGGHEHGDSPISHGPGQDTHFASHGDYEHSSSTLMRELRAHIPFSVSSVVLGLVLAGIICVLCLGFLGGAGADAHGCTAAHLPGTPAVAHDHEHAEDVAGPVAALPEEHGHEHAHAHTPPQLLFHLFHPAHMFFSAAATTAMFFRYERRLLKAIIIGIIGAIGVCGVSDIVMPHFSVMLLGVRPPWHICIIEHPMLVIPFALVGVVVGLAAPVHVRASTLYSHSLHVFVSTMASVFYMVGPLGLVEWIDRIGWVMMFVVLAVMIPCCVSDIIFPLLFTRSGRAHFEAHGRGACGCG
ncbi:MAG TPA: hypothetical protein PKK06_02035 [Phycisphaerae bacterium]|nr:hypothetical protein [Phycisphaerae bacterium]HNU44095.1 hypothetical protein [Phycisphaerae bacterium]